MDLKEACVEEAFRIIGEVGVECLSIREVARRLGVSHQASYKHFPSGDHLLAEIVRRTYVLFSEHLESRPRGHSPAEDLKFLGEAYVSFAMQHPLHYRLIFGAVLPDPSEHTEMMQEARKAFAILLEGVARLHGLDPAQKPARQTQLDALFIWASVHGLATILQTTALEEIGLGKLLLKDALPHSLECIGRAMARKPS